MKSLATLIAAFVSLSAPVWAQAVPANLYECTGDEVTINYATSGITGRPTLTVHFRNATITRSGDDIRTEDTVLGSLVTIVRRTIPDLLTATLTLLVPAVNLTANTPAVTFTTSFFTTRTLTSLGGPELVEGLIQRSTSRPVVCHATGVIF
jgi:hypothetical protein